MSDRGLRWNLPALDGVCRRLGDLGGLLLVFEARADQELVWTRAESGILSHARQAGLRAMGSEWTVESTQDLSRRVRSESLDLLVACAWNKDETMGRQFASDLGALPCALVALSGILPSNWELAFEAAIVFVRGQARILRREKPGQSETVPCSLRAEAAPSALPPRRLGSRVVTLGLTQKERKFVAKSLGLGELRDLGLSESAKNELPCDLLLVRGSFENERIREAVKIQVEADAPVVALGSGINREEDRASFYAAGARSVLPKECALEELGAAAAANLGLADSGRDPFRAWLLAMDQALSRTPKAKLWKLGEEEEARAIYQPVISLQLKRAQDLELTPGALLLRLPKLPAAITEAGWDKLLKKTLLSSLLDTLRVRDLSFVVDETLVVISHHMDRLAARAVVRRISEQLPDPGADSAAWRIVSGPVDGELGEASATLVRDVFAAVKSGIKPGSQEGAAGG